MLTDITLGQYFPGDSPVHRLDPRFKILLTMFYIVILFCVKNITGLILVSAVFFYVALISGIKLRFMFKGLKPMLFLLVFSGALNLFVTEGRELFKIWRLTATYEGAYFAVFMIIRLIFLVMGSMMLTYTTSPITLTDGIERLLSPFRRLGVPSHEIAMMMTIAIRFIPTILEEADKIIKAQSARGADFESGNLFKRARALVPLLVPLFISAFRRADELAVAMECRCYHGGDGRTRMKGLKVTKSDYQSLILAAVLVFMAVVGNLYGI